MLRTFCSWTLLARRVTFGSMPALLQWNAQGQTQASISSALPALER